MRCEYLIARKRERDAARVNVRTEDGEMTDMDVDKSYGIGRRRGAA